MGGHTCGTVACPVSSLRRVRASSCSESSSSSYGIPASCSAVFAFLQYGHPSVVTTATRACVVAIGAASSKAVGTLAGSARARSECR